MAKRQWAAVDDYLTDRLAPADPILKQALETNAAAALPAHDVSPLQGKFLHVIARSIGARKILEIGTLGGYATIWLARALPCNGIVVTLEAVETHAAVARTNIERANLSASVDLRIGPALQTLPMIEAEGLGPFDLIFIDADKPNNPEYLAWAMKLSRSGTIIVGDNIVRDGEVADPTSDDERVLGVRKFFDLIAAESRLTATAIQTVGSKGCDGFMMAIVD